MNFKSFMNQNGSTLLTVLGIIGTAATVVLSVKATLDAKEAYDEATAKKGAPLTVKETVKVVAKPAIAPAAMFVGTAACMIGAHACDKKKMAAFSSTYALLREGFNEYQKKTKEIAGPETEKKIRTAVVAEGITKRENEYEKCVVEDDDEIHDFHIKLECFEHPLSVHTTYKNLMLAEFKADVNLELFGDLSVLDFIEILDESLLDDIWDCGYENYGWSMDLGLNKYNYNRLIFDHKLKHYDNGVEFYEVTCQAPVAADFQG